MVAYLQDSALDDERLAAKIQKHRAKGSSMPLFHEAMQKWYYKDPQGEIQGRSVPFTLPLLFPGIVKEFFTGLPPTDAGGACFYRSSTGNLPF